MESEISIPVGDGNESVSEDVSVRSETEVSGTSVKPTVVDKHCQVCGEVCVKRKRCKKCKSGVYCSRSCRKDHAESHGELCQYIQELERIEKSKHVFSVRASGLVGAKNRLVRLVGDRPTLNCR